MLLAAAFVLNLSLESEVEVAGFIRPLGVAVAIAALLTLAFWPVFRNRWDGALAASITILLMISVVPVHRAWQTVEGAFGPSASLATFAAAVAFLGASVLILVLRARSGRPAPRPSAASLNAFTAVLVAVVVLCYTIPHVPVVLGRLTVPPLAVAVAPPAPPPDIFVVLLDGYPDKEVLERRFGIDNSSFLDQLTGWGFDVAVNSRSNYASTSLTLASMFQMRYVDEIAAIQPSWARREHAMTF